MRRVEKEITDRGEMEGVIRRAQLCRLGMARENNPYVVPLCFGYAEGVLYAHSAREGMKLEILRENPAVCVEFSTDVELVRNPDPWKCSMRYRSVIGFGRATLVEDPEEKRAACALLMRQYGDGSSEFPEQALAKVAIIRVDIETMTGKQSGY